VLDLESDAGRDGLARLCAGADVVIESGAVPIDLAALRAADPALVTVSITAFGSNGPKAAWPATDLTVNAAACQLAMTGDDDRPPVRTAVPQSFLHACSDAAVGALRGAARARVGGQHAEVSAQRSMLQATQSYVWRSRSAGWRRRVSGGSRPPGSTSSCCGRAQTASSRCCFCSVRRSGRSRLG
jgi:crotonobetainyl-CoA:carnitine CoA-transferase CaiB-like acyl-CoA transferase